MLTNLPFDICPVCASLNARGRPDANELCYFECSACGPYLIATPTAFDIHPKQDTGRDFDPHRFKLACYIRRRVIEGKQPPIILPSRKGLPDLTGRAIGIDDVREWRRPSQAERLDHTLLNLAALSEEPGYPLEVRALPWTIGLAESRSVFEYLIAELEYAGHVKEGPKEPGDPGLGSAHRLTSKGWNRVAELHSSPAAAKPRQAFVAMSFATDLRPVYDQGIRPGIEAAGYDALRMDDLLHADLIDDRMLAEIRQSRFLVADLTGVNPGAYFEAGFARGLGLPVIYTIRAGEGCHFDTNHYPLLQWTTHEDLREELKYRILATIGPPAD
jgi:hypothetical protein